MSTSDHLSPRCRAQATYLFDARGYHIEKGFLQAEELEASRHQFELDDLSPEAWHADQSRAEHLAERSTHFGALARRLHEHPLTQLLITYPARLLESYGIDRRSGRLDLHGGAREYLVTGEAVDTSASTLVHDGRIYCSRLKVLIYLDAVDSLGDGLFTYVEGSHKSNFAFHRAFPLGRTDAPAALRRVRFEAGDAMWLNEALLHGADAKTSAKSRRLVAFTFGPSFMADWSEPGKDNGKTSYQLTEVEEVSGRADG